jgi:hypothetical protein
MAPGLIVGDNVLYLGCDCGSSLVVVKIKVRHERETE